ncbi:hypothetical protein BDE02_02G024300 [Populus trichocarpa]|nr:hypothetical protein BDE02_02G024300 [Populus trichocarpa]
MNQHFHLNHRSVEETISLRSLRNALSSLCLSSHASQRLEHCLYVTFLLYMTFFSYVLFSWRQICSLVLSLVHFFFLKIPWGFLINLSRATSITIHVRDEEFIMSTCSLYSSFT